MLGPYMGEWTGCGWRDEKWHKFIHRNKVGEQRPNDLSHSHLGAKEEGSGMSGITMRFEIHHV